MGHSPLRQAPGLKNVLGIFVHHGVGLLSIAGKSPPPSRRLAPGITFPAHQIFLIFDRGAAKEMEAIR